MKLQEIREIARQHNINTEGLLKTELIREIQGHEGYVNCYATSHVRECGQKKCLWRIDCQVAARAGSVK